MTGARAGLAMLSLRVTVHDGSLTIDSLLLMTNYCGSTACFYCRARTARVLTLKQLLAGRYRIPNSFLARSRRTLNSNLPIPD
jgi:hypothetical protein